eukprot:561878-Pyramimonas_sp.AAC.1
MATHVEAVAGVFINAAGKPLYDAWQKCVNAEDVLDIEPIGEPGRTMKGRVARWRRSTMRRSRGYE